MLTIEKIKENFSYIQTWTGNSESYHDSTIFEGYGEMCDLYFKSIDKQIKQEQVDKYNDFKVNYTKYLPEIEEHIISTIKKSEVILKNTINQAKLFIDVIEIPFDNFKYDMVVVYSKTYNRFIFLTRNIDIRVEFKNGLIKSIQRKNETTEDNE
jgi:hypothetical protein